MEHQQDLTGRTIVITGASSGIGFETARCLSRRGARVIGVGRSEERCVNAKNAILSEYPQSNPTFLVADLACQRQIHQLAADIRGSLQTDGEEKIDVLINNAGTVSSWYSATEDGYELQFSVNHLASFLLTHKLMPLLQAAPSARIVTVSSNSHRRAHIHWDDVMLRTRYHILRAYKQSKVANILFTYELNRRFGTNSNLRAYAIDPGLVNTQIGKKGTGGFERWFWEKRRRRGVSPEEGVSTIVFVAADLPVNDSLSSYWKDSRPARPSRYATREDEAARLWELSERLCGIRFVFENEE